MLRLIVGAILFLALGETAHAHFLWLERDGDGPAGKNLAERVIFRRFRSCKATAYAGPTNHSPQVCGKAMDTLVQKARVEKEDDADLSVASLTCNQIRLLDIMNWLQLNLKETR